MVDLCDMLGRMGELEALMRLQCRQETGDL
jgi:hypothetical protein